ncbi:MAG TPA: prepilin-type N-terminal cleavage/methylation domain-containing protein [Phycisphaerales bacterium]|nr:prepilin-type N-terminal cleavage/methylation domain-containing protein [Phycisphaerales bacterium]
MCSRGGFSLIELLVTIAIIALLVGITLPGLGRARDSARAAVCLSNTKQLGLGATMSAQANKDTLCWGSDWLQADNADEVEPGAVLSYLDGAEAVLSCPSSESRMGGAWTVGPDGKKRPVIVPDDQTPGADPGSGKKKKKPKKKPKKKAKPGPGGPGGPGDPRDPADAESEEPVYTDIYTDYTMFAGVEGAKLETQTMVGHVRRPADYSDRPATVDDAAELSNLGGVPVFLEENAFVWLEGYPDGLWSEGDQLTLRHGRGGHMAFLDGHVGRLAPPAGSAESEEEPEDLTAEHFYAAGSGGRWVRVESMGTSERPFGWINSPAP